MPEGATICQEVPGDERCLEVPGAPGAARRCQELPGINPIESVVLLSPESKDVSKEVLDQCEEFVNHADSLRRGYLLHRVAGSGKSSLAMEVPSHLHLPIY